MRTTQGVMTVTRPELRTIPDVELVKVGAWPASTGDVEIQPKDLEAAVVAAGSPSVRKPILKLGHVDPRFDGEPAVGWVDNIRLSNDGLTLLGDLKGVPSWLADIMPSAYPDRSIEAQFGAKDQTGKIHDFVLTGLALLGVSPPAVGTLTSLQDVAGLYGLGDESPDVKFTVSEVPNVVQLSNNVTSEDVRKSFYESGPGNSVYAWLVELFVDPTEAIAEGDDGELYRVPFTVGDESVEWGELQKVKREYVAASASESVVKFSGKRPAKGENKMDPMQGLREAFGLAEDATKADLAQALLSAADEGEQGGDTPPADPEPTGGDEGDEGDEMEATDAGKALQSIAERLGVEVDGIDDALDGLAGKADLSAKADEDTVVLDKDRYQELVDLSARGEKANEEAFEREGEELVAAAVKDGRLGAAAKGRWLEKFRAEPEDTKQRLSALAPGRIPREEVGHSAPGNDEDDEGAESAALTEKAKAEGIIPRARV